MNNISITATEFRNSLFEVLNSTIKGKEFIIEKDGRPAARLIPYTSHTSSAKVKSILNNFKSAFSNTDHKKPWSVMETSSWKEKEKKYLKKPPMKRIVIDTDILIDYSKGYANWLGDLLASDKRTTDLIIPTIVISEYFASNLLEDPRLASATDALFSLFRKQDFNEEIAKILAKILRNKIYPKSASLADLMIASTAIYLDAELATRNKSDFDKISGIRLFEVKEKKN